jgi:hypothetical protein
VQKRKVVPNFLKLNVPYYKNRKVSRILHKTGLLLLKERISSARQERRRIQQECGRRVQMHQKVGRDKVVQVLTSVDKKQARVKTAGRKTWEKDLGERPGRRISKT